MEEARKIKRKLLYVDDDELSLDSIKKLLEDEYDIDTAQTPIKALELAKANDYDAILMDIGIGFDTNGMELTKEMRKIRGYKNKPFVALTAYASIRDKRHFLENGLDYYIAKPFFKKDILALLDRVFKERVSSKDS